MRALPGPEAPTPEPQPPRGAEAVRGAQAARRSAVERLAADRAKYLRGPAAGPDPDPGPGPGPVAEAPGPPVARRAIARRPLRPDSLVIYRQKCEFARAPGADGPKAALGKKRLPGPSRDPAPEPLEAPRGVEAAGTPARAGPPTTPAGAQAQGAGREPRAASRGGLRRSQSDLSSSRSVARAEVDTFFQHCGLDPEVVEALGRENFSAGSDRVALKVRSVSVATSDCGFSRHSSWEDDGLQEEIMEQVPSTTSVVEKNARIIKWLFACKKAKETPSQEPQGPA